jgi:hypothetical protein
MRDNMLFVGRKMASDLRVDEKGRKYNELEKEFTTYILSLVVSATTTHTLTHLTLISLHLSPPLNHVCRDIVTCQERA